MSENANSTSAAPTNIQIDDVLFALFRRKWWVILFSILGVAVAGGIWYMMPKMYESTAKIMIRYVAESGSLNPVDGEMRVKTPDSRGANIINTEMEIIRSTDLAVQVSQAVGPEQILESYGGGTNSNAAAGKILGNLTVEGGRDSNVIEISLKHPDPSLARQILQEFVDRYMQKHIQVHRAVGSFEFLTQQTDQLRNRLDQTEEELKNIKQTKGIISLENQQRIIGEEISRIRQALSETQIQLAERKARMADLEKLNPQVEQVERFAYSSDIINQYQSISKGLLNAKNQQLELLSEYTDQHPAMQKVNRRIEEYTRAKKELEAQYPELTQMSLDTNGNGMQTADLVNETATISSLEAKASILTNQLDKLQKEALALESLSNTLRQLERKRRFEETNYVYFSTKLEQVKIDEALNSSKISNISIVQNPSTAGLDNETTRKAALGAVCGGLALGLGLAVGWQLFLDPRVQRPSQLRKQLGVAVVSCIPHLRWRRVRRKKSEPQPILDPAKNEAFLPYLEEIREKLAWYRTKSGGKCLITGITSCSGRAGVSTLAHGLSTLLSQEGESSVLLVNGDARNPAIYHFKDGHIFDGLSDERPAQETDQKSETALIPIDSEMKHKLAVNRAALPKSISLFVEKVRTSDYDYVLFDLPAIGKEKNLHRLFFFFDIILCVVEQEKDTVANLKHIYSSLKEMAGKACFWVCMNKIRYKAPQSLYR